MISDFKFSAYTLIKQTARGADINKQSVLIMNTWISLSLRVQLLMHGISNFTSYLVIKLSFKVSRWLSHSATAALDSRRLEFHLEAQNLRIICRKSALTLCKMHKSEKKRRLPNRKAIQTRKLIWTKRNLFNELWDLLCFNTFSLSALRDKDRTE